VSFNSQPGVDQQMSQRFVVAADAFADIDEIRLAVVVRTI
jgi:hypothetical protein